MLKYKNTLLQSDKKDWIQTEVNTPGGENGLIDANNEHCVFVTGNSSSIGLCKHKTSGKVVPVKFNCNGAITALKWASDRTLLVASSAGVETLEFNDGKLTQLKSYSASYPVTSLNLHPLVKEFAAIGGGLQIELFNLETGSSVLKVGLSAKFEACDWNLDGKLLAHLDIERDLKICDPRLPSSAQAFGKAHSGNKKLGITWCGNTRVLTAGVSSSREREIAIWDTRMLTSAVQRCVIDRSQGFISPLYDHDSSLAYICGKGDYQCRTLIIDNELDSQPGNFASLSFTAGTAINGICMIPKLSVNVMACEVSRLLTIQQNNIIPVSVKVPRKQTYEFQSDLFPDTRTFERTATIEDWENGIDSEHKFKKLNPKAVTLSPVQNIQPQMAQKTSETYSEVVSPKVTLPKHTPFRHLLTTSKLRWEDMKVRSLNASNQAEVFQVNEKLFAFQTQGPGGRLSIVARDVQRVGDAPCLINGSDLNDFRFDPFDDYVVYTACDDGKIRKFRIPKYLKEDVTVAEFSISAHAGRVLMLAVHLLVRDLLVSTSNEFGTTSVKVFDMKARTCLQTINIDTVPLAFSFDFGNNLGILTKDFVIYDAITGSLVKKYESHKGSRAARCIYLHGPNIWCSVGFSAGSNRELLIYKEGNNQTIPLDQGPALLVPGYDIDTKLLYFTARGETGITFIQIVDEDDGFIDLGKQQISTAETISFLAAQKLTVNVKGVEIIRGHRLCQNGIEEVSITVPRVKIEYFQDDIFPNTIDFIQSAIEASEWKADVEIELKYVSLCPEGMKQLSDSPRRTVVKQARTFEEVISEEQRKEATLKSMFDNANLESDGPLKQDLMEGVADDECFGFISITKYSKLWDIDLILAPSFLGVVMQNAGNQPPATNPFKGRYMLEDIKVGSSMFGTKQLRIPKGFPGNSLQAQRILTAVKLKVPHKLIQVSLDFWDAYWICGKPLTDDTFAEILQRNLQNASEIMQLSQTETVKKELIDTTKEAMTAGAFGFPWFVCEKDGQKQMFFGSDRLEAMAHWLQLPYYGANPKSKL